MRVVNKISAKIGAPASKDEIVERIHVRGVINGVQKSDQGKFGMSYRFIGAFRADIPGNDDYMVVSDTLFLPSSFSEFLVNSAVPVDTIIDDDSGDELFNIPIDCIVISVPSESSPVGYVHEVEVSSDLLLSVGKLETSVLPASLNE